MADPVEDHKGSSERDGFPPHRILIPGRSPWKSQVQQHSSGIRLLPTSHRLRIPAIGEHGSSFPNHVLIQSSRDPPRTARFPQMRRLLPGNRNPGNPYRKIPHTVSQQRQGRDRRGTVGEVRHGREQGDGADRPGDSERGFGK